ncbi:MAG: O-methyltransferase [Bacteroidia bacterium]
MNHLRILYRYLLYYIHASTRHDLHSPFMFSLMTEVIEKDQKTEVHHPIEQLRKELLSSGEELDVLDLGAGSFSGKPEKRSLKSITRNTSKSARYARLLYRLSARFRPDYILELGTSTGISSLYLHAGHPEASLITIEGSPCIAEQAWKNFIRLGAPDIQLMTGSFEEKLPLALKQMPVAGLVFFDGNHRKAPTLDYFRQCLEKAGEDSVFIFDDIHWSDEMTEAWEEIKTHEAVTVTADLFFMGLVFFRKGQEKQHFTLRY